MNLNKNALLTGAAGGMGRCIASSLLEAGYRLFMIARPESIAKDLCRRWNDEYGRGRCVLILCDLSEPSQIASASDYLHQEITSLDLLVNNAGILCSKPATNSLGWEMQWSVNCLAPSFLCRLLEDLLHRGSRVVNTVSCTVWTGRIPYTMPPENLFFPYSGLSNRFIYYSDSKLGLMLYSFYLASIWKEKGITVNCADPGIVNTSIIRMENPIIDPLCDIFFRPIIKQPAVGASTAIHLALSKEVSNQSRGFYRSSRRVNMPSYMENHAREDDLVSGVNYWLKNCFSI